MIGYALRSLTRRPFVALVLSFGLGVAFGLPIAIEMANRQVGQALRQRAAAAPLVLGAEGSPTDLVVHALEFAGEPPGRIEVADWRALAKTERVEAAPLFVAGRARGVPVVGVDGAYFRVRGLKLAGGGPIDRIGDAVIGAETARRLGIEPGETLSTDVAELFSLAGTLPVRLNVVGALAPRGTADDLAIFVNLETAWLIAGLGHSHANPGAAHDGPGAAPGDGTLGEGVVAITDRNAQSFHFHGDESGFPLTAVLARARSEKDRLWLAGHYVVRSDDVQLAEADRLIDALLERALRIKRILNVIVAVSLLATIGLAGALAWLTLRLRWHEFQTMARLGISRTRIAMIGALELAMLLAGACGVALGLALLLSWMGPSLFAWVVL